MSVRFYPQDASKFLQIETKFEKIGQLKTAFNKQLFLRFARSIDIHCRSLGGA